MRFTGTITTYFESKRYGFITSDADGISRFFHDSNCLYPPRIGMAVEFELGAPNRLGKEPQCLRISALVGSTGGPQ
jgi:cold shock CspA family protein